MNKRKVRIKASEVNQETKKEAKYKLSEKIVIAGIKASELLKEKS